jgi:hypothetical protein
LPIWDRDDNQHGNKACHGPAGSYLYLKALIREAVKTVKFIPVLGPVSEGLPFSSASNQKNEISELTDGSTNILWEIFSEHCISFLYGTLFLALHRCRNL